MIPQSGKYQGAPYKPDFAETPQILEELQNAAKAKGIKLPEDGRIPSLFYTILSEDRNLQEVHEAIEQTECYALQRAGFYLFLEYLGISNEGISSSGWYEYDHSIRPELLTRVEEKIQNSSGALKEKFKNARILLEEIAKIDSVINKYRTEYKGSAFIVSNSCLNDPSVFHFQDWTLGGHENAKTIICPEGISPEHFAIVPLGKGEHSILQEIFPEAYSKWNKTNELNKRFEDDLRKQRIATGQIIDYLPEGKIIILQTINTYTNKAVFLEIEGFLNKPKESYQGKSHEIEIEYDESCNKLILIDMEQVI